MTWRRTETEPQYTRCHRCGWVSSPEADLGPVRQLFVHWRQMHHGGVRLVKREGER